MNGMKKMAAMCGVAVMTATGVVAAAPAALANVISPPPIIEAPNEMGAKPVDRVGHARLVQDGTQANRMKKKAKVELTSIAPAHDQAGTGGLVEKLPVRKVKGQMLILDGGIQFVSTVYKGTSFQCRQPIVHLDTRAVSCQIPGDKSRTTTFKIVSTPQTSVKGRTTYVNNMMLAIASNKVANRMDATFRTGFFNEGQVIGTMNAMYKATR